MLKELCTWSKTGQVLILTLFLLASGTIEIVTNLNSITPQANAQNIINPIVNNPFPNIASFTNSGSQFSPWFPSVPAIACGGLFSLTITGKPHINVNVHGSSNNNKDLLALQVTSTPPLSNGVTSFSKVDGTIVQGKKNIEHNRLHDFDVKNVFNNCRMLAFSKSKNPSIATPVPTMTNGIVTSSGLLTNGGLNQVCPTGYQQDIYGNCVANGGLNQVCPTGYQRDIYGNCVV